MMDNPKNAWLTLHDLILNLTDEINKDTPWAETEPAWWLEMMEVRKIVLAGARQTRENQERETAALRQVVRWAYDYGHTPPNMSREVHKKLAGL